MGSQFGNPHTLLAAQSCSPPPNDRARGYLDQVPQLRSSSVIHPRHRRRRRRSTPSSHSHLPRTSWVKDIRSGYLSPQRPPRPVRSRLRTPSRPRDFHARRRRLPGRGQRLPPDLPTSRSLFWRLRASRPPPASCGRVSSRPGHQARLQPASCGQVTAAPCPLLPLRVRVQASR